MTSVHTIKSKILHLEIVRLYLFFFFFFNLLEMVLGGGSWFVDQTLK